MLMGDLTLWLGRNPHIRRRVLCAMKSRPDLFTRFLATHTRRTDSTSLLSAGGTAQSSSPSGFPIFRDTARLPVLAL